MGKTALATNIAFNIAKAYQFEVEPDGSHKPSMAALSASSRWKCRQSNWRRA